MIAIQGYEWDFKIELTNQAQKNLNKALNYFNKSFLKQITQ